MIRSELNVHCTGCRRGMMYGLAVYGEKASACAMQSWREQQNQQLPTTQRGDLRIAIEACGVELVNRKFVGDLNYDECSPPVEYSIQSE